MSADGAAPPRFEGSYMGSDAKITAAAVMECKICWTPYDPAEGDESRQVPPGAAFTALPGDWSCPVCGAPKEQFMVLRDPGAAAPGAGWIAPAVARLEAEFREIFAAKIRDTPLANRALAVKAVGFGPWEGSALGVLTTPWFMSLVLLPGPGRDWSGLVNGTKELIAFPGGLYEFIHARRAVCGPYKTCSLFSPMAEFASQQKAEEVAAAVIPALMDPRNRADPLAA